MAANDKRATFPQFANRPIHFLYESSMWNCRSSRHFAMSLLIRAKLQRYDALARQMYRFMSLYRETGNMLRDPSLLCVVVLLLCDLASSESYANLSRIDDNYRRIHRPHRKRIASAERDSGGPRIPKLFSFHALDEDMKVDLEFAVPFLHVPIKKSMVTTNQAFKSLANLNTPALLVSGLFVVVGAGFGLLFNTFVGQTTGVKRKSRITDVSSLLDPFKLIYRSADGEKSETAFGDLIETIEGKFRENNIDITACIQKSICSFVRKSAERVRGGRGTGTNKIIDGLASSDWILQYLEGTAVRDAIDAGNGITNCGYKYSTCKWSSPENLVMELALGFFENPGIIKT